MAANAADVSGRPVAAVQLQQVSTACLGIDAKGAESAGRLRLAHISACWYLRSWQSVSVTVPVCSAVTQHWVPPLRSMQLE